LYAGFYAGISNAGPFRVKPHCGSIPKIMGQITQPPEGANDCIHTKAANNYCSAPKFSTRNIKHFGKNPFGPGVSLIP